MNEFEKWKKSIPAGDGYSAQDAFEAGRAVGKKEGMLAAADISDNEKHRYPSPDALEDVCLDIYDAITNAAEKL